MYQIQGALKPEIKGPCKSQCCIERAGIITHPKTLIFDSEEFDKSG